MSKHTLTTAEREARVERRRKLREAAAAKVETLRQWRIARTQDAEKRAQEKAAELRGAPRGVDRIPDTLGGLSVVLEPHLESRVRPHRGGTTIDSTIGTFLGKDGNYADRRARGQRGKPRPLRRREMPGAQARRIERIEREQQQAAQVAEEVSS